MIHGHDNGTPEAEREWALIQVALAAVFMLSLFLAWLYS